MPVQPASAEIGDSAVTDQEVVPADADSVDATEDAREPRGTEPPTNEFPSIKVIGSWGQTREAGPHGQRPDGFAASNVRLTTPAPADEEAAGLTVTVEPAVAAPPEPTAASEPAGPSALPASEPVTGGLTVTIASATTHGESAASETVVQAEPAPRPAESASAAPAAAASQPAWRAPGLDGVRALAVLAVIAFHEGLPWIPGGFLGVDVFFVLSGYLITDLLAARHRKEGRIGLGRFYQRRARRLLPGLALMLLTVTAAVSLLEPGQRGTLRPALLGAVTYTSNWWQAFAHQSYFSLYGPPPAFQHLWSLAVEEQFYLIWPLLLAAILMLVRRPVSRALFAWGGALTSALIMLVIYTPGGDPSLVYYGTDTHASALMIGAALAITFPLAKVAATTGRTRQVLDILGALGLVVLAWSVWHLAGSNEALYPYGLVLAAVAAGGLILAAAAPGRIGRLTSWKPLRWLGIRSYGVYLWHWPVIAITTGLAPRSAASAPVRVLDTVLPVALAAASWRWLEEPILRHGLRAELGRRGRLVLLAPRGFLTTPSAAVPTLTAVALLAVAGTAGYGLANAGQGPTLQAQIRKGLRVSATTMPFEPPGQSYPRWVIPGRRPFQHAVHVKVRKPKPFRAAGAKVLAIGDSVMLASAPELATAMPGISINAKISRAMIAGISIVDKLARSRRLRRVVIVGLGTNGPITAGQVRQLRSAVGDRWLVLINTFVPRSWEHEVNTTLARAARRYPNVLLVNWHNAIEHHQGLLWNDDIHPQPVGGKLYARVVRKVVLHALHKRPRLSVRHRHAPAQARLSGFLLHAKYATLY
ncbi:MAG TPA: acyltransferase family protein [Streptosporangiaceae bacterium]|nr:acyltransferase family protein [Streptosporangiaceae bacterium]